MKNIPNRADIVFKGRVPQKLQNKAIDKLIEFFGEGDNHKICRGNFRDKFNEYKPKLEKLRNEMNDIGLTLYVSEVRVRNKASLWRFALCEQRIHKLTVKVGNTGTKDDLPF